MSIYMKSFRFPSEEEENFLLWPPQLTPEEVKRETVRDYRLRNHKGSIYPFTILSRFSFNNIVFSDITILYGENGCGKSTALNVMAEKLGIKRETPFNSGRFFQDYVELCEYNLSGNDDDYFRLKYHDDGEISLPVGSKIITSDDIFSIILKTREYNTESTSINEMIETELKNRKYDSNIERIFAHKNLKNEIQRRMLGEKDEQSNGQNAIEYFIKATENNALYILDEPENSLSIESQINLAEYIECMSHKSQFIIATHSPIIAGLSNAKIYSFENNEVITQKWEELPGIRCMYEYYKKRNYLF